MTNNYYENAILTELCKNRTQVTAFLSNGYQLKGCITHFDDMVIVMEIDGHPQMLYKHILSTLMPHHTLTSLL